MEPLSDSSDDLARALRYRDDRLAESVSRMMHEAALTAEVKSALSTPLLDNDELTGGVNLDGAQDATVEQVPAGSEELETIGAAVDVLVGTHRVSHEQACHHLEQAAARARVPVLALALMILHDRS